MCLRYADDDEDAVVESNQNRIERLSREALYDDALEQYEGFLEDSKVCVQFNCMCSYEC